MASGPGITSARFGGQHQAPTGVSLPVPPPRWPPTTRTTRRRSAGTHGGVLRSASTSRIVDEVHRRGGQANSRGHRLPYTGTSTVVAVTAMCSQRRGQLLCFHPLARADRLDHPATRFAGGLVATSSLIRAHLFRAAAGPADAYFDGFDGEEHRGYITGGGPPTYSRSAAPTGTGSGSGGSAMSRGRGRGRGNVPTELSDLALR